MSWLRLLFIPVMAWLSRMCGGAPPQLGRPWPQLLYALPLGIAASVGGLWCLPALGGAYYGKATGHGLWMSLAHVIKKCHTEPLDFIVAWFWGQDPRVVATDDTQAVTLSQQYGLTKLYWRCVTGMVVVGLAVTIIPGIVFAVFHSLIGGLILVASGAMAGPAYMIGWIIYPTGQGSGPPQLNQATQIGEFLTGLFTGIALAVIWPF